MLPCMCDFTSDINECLIGTHNCHDVAECSNTNGSFYCNCTPGFIGNGTYCQGIRYIATFWTIKIIIHFSLVCFKKPFFIIYQPLNWTENGRKSVLLEQFNQISPLMFKKSINQSNQKVFFLVEYWKPNEPKAIDLSETRPIILFEHRNYTLLPGLSGRAFL